MRQARSLHTIVHPVATYRRRWLTLLWLVEVALHGPFDQSDDACVQQPISLHQRRRSEQVKLDKQSGCRAC